MTVNDLSYVLLDEEHVAVVRRAVLDAVRGGGGFVELPTGHSSTVEVLVTPATTFTLEHHRLPDENADRRIEPPDDSAVFMGAIDPI